MIEVEKYLNNFGFGKSIDNQELWNEMDKVWDSLNLDNRVPFSKQNIGAFYSHPVWILNGLFSENDKVSYNHRKLIVNYAKDYFKSMKDLNIADFGGGSGVLAKIFEDELNNINNLEIIEPWPSNYFVEKFKSCKKLKFSNDFQALNYYDLIVAQDVLEHVENPIDITFNCVNATKVGGLLIFANCFYPHIKCHLPQNFYLRNLFRFVITSKNLKYIGRLPGAYHIEIFQKTGIEYSKKYILFKNILAKILGPVLNFFVLIFLYLKRVLNN